MRNCFCYESRLPRLIPWDPQLRPYSSKALKKQAVSIPPHNISHLKETELCEPQTARKGMSMSQARQTAMSLRVTSPAQHRCLHQSRHPHLPYHLSKRLYSTSTPPKSPNLGLNATLAIAAIAAAGIAYYYDITSSSSSSSSTGTGILSHKDDFEVTIGRGERARTFTYPRLSTDGAGKKLRAHESGEIVDRVGNPVLKWDRTVLESNEPCEDRSAVDLIPRKTSSRNMPSFISRLFGTNPIDESSTTQSTDSNKRGEGSGVTGGEKNGNGEKDIMLFSIMDGHGGWATSDLLSKVLHPTLTLSLIGLQSGMIPNENGWNGILKKVNPFSWVGEVWGKENVMKTISAA